MKLARDGVLWVPDADARFHKAGVGYEQGLYNLTIPFCRRRDLAVDVGAHVGVWTRRLVDDFASVHSFEPVPEHADCLVRNAPGATIHRVALSNQRETLRMSIVEANSGKSRVTDTGELKVSAEPLDDYGLAPDLIKIDVEHHEPYVLAGAMETIRRHRPVLMIEVRDFTRIFGVLEPLGYRLELAQKINHLFVSR